LPEPDLPEPGRGAVLITRPEPGASETAARLRSLGFLPVLAPVLEIVRTDARLPPSDAVAAIVVTSANAVPALPATFRYYPLLTVGDATAARARAAGFDNVTSADGDAVALAALVARLRRPGDGALLLATGQGQGHRLARMLRQGGYRVLRRVVYHAAPVGHLPEAAHAALRRGAIRAALFFSAETARHFVTLARMEGLTGTVRDSEAVAIGAPTGVALEALPWRRISVAARPNQDAMLALLR
jgi:uroporphyrinogen-III synthase